MIYFSSIYSGKSLMELGNLSNGCWLAATVLIVVAYLGLSLFDNGRQSVWLFSDA